jgi:hypothetical protein
MKRWKHGTANPRQEIGIRRCSTCCTMVRRRFRHTSRPGRGALSGRVLAAAAVPVAARQEPLQRASALIVNSCRPQPAPHVPQDPGLLLLLLLLLLPPVSQAVPVRDNLTARCQSWCSTHPPAGTAAPHSGQLRTDEEEDGCCGCGCGCGCCCGRCFGGGACGGRCPPTPDTPRPVPVPAAVRDEGAAAGAKAAEAHSCCRGR